MRMRSLQTVVALVTCSFVILAAGQITHPSEVRALKAVLRSIKDPRKILRSWKKGDPCESGWRGVICEEHDGYSHVTELRLLKMNLSGTLAPELGQLSYATILDFMWNNISGSIPKEIGNMNYLELLLLSGNQISGPLPDELGYLPNITKFQLDLNYISGPLPKSFANLTKVKHFHMNNNSISGQIPPELSALPKLIHFLLDNNNLSGHLPPELAEMQSLTILQLDNNNFEGTGIPDSYANMSNLLKLSLRNCKLQGPVPDFSGIPRLLYVDLSDNQLTGGIPENTLSRNITTIDLSNNMLNGSIPSSFSGLPRLQRLSLENNFLIGDVPSAIWQNMTFIANATLTLDFQNNSLSNITGILNPPSNVMIKLQGNPVCRRAGELSIGQFCGFATPYTEEPGSSNKSTMLCPPQSCPADDYYEYVTASPVQCFCALPFGIGLRLRSPSFSNFLPYIDGFEAYITSNFRLSTHQLSIDSFIWQKGPRLLMFLKIFPPYTNTSSKFNESEIQRIRDYIATFKLPGDDTFGPYDLLNFTLFGSYANFDIEPLQSDGLSNGARLGIVIGAVSGGVAIVLVIAVLYRKTRARHQNETSKKQKLSTIPFRTGNIKEFDFKELESATENFSITTQIGQGGYGKVYRGTVADGTVVAIKRAQQLSLHGQKEFFTEIEFLSRLHHRNLVSLVGYCHEEGEQMLVYEFMPNGSLHDILSGRFKKTLNLAMRLHIAMGSAKGILYLHTEADPPIIHRDIKATNILLDNKFNAKVSDFGISRLAPVQDIIGASSQVSTAVKGTPGYVDPEYFLSHKLTHKSDVYSLGIVFLELLTGMPPISHGKNIVREVCTACQSGMMFSIIDRNMGPYPSECVKKFMALALKCCEDETDSRPSMLEVVRELENISSTLAKSDTIPSESDTSASGAADLGPPTLHSRGSTAYATNDFSGSDLVSGVIPSIRPR